MQAARRRLLSAGAQNNGLQMRADLLRSIQAPIGCTATLIYQFSESVSLFCHGLDQIEPDSQQGREGKREDSGQTDRHGLGSCHWMYSDTDRPVQRKRMSLPGTD